MDDGFLHYRWNGVRLVKMDKGEVISMMARAKADVSKALQGDHPYEEPQYDPEAEKTFYLLMHNERKG